MNRIVAALDDGPGAAGVAAVAARIGALLSVPVEAVHVREGNQRTVAAAADAAGLPLRVLEGEPVAVLAAAFGDDVLLGVLGSRRNPRHQGHLALAVSVRTPTPLLVVPPELHVPEQWPARVALPMEGGEQGEPVQPLIERLLGAGLRAVPVHVLRRAPAFWDEPAHEQRAWCEEFMARNWPQASERLQLRIGPPESRLLEAVEQEGVDLLALSWGQDLSPGRAKVVREALRRARVPVLLLPRTPHPGRRPWRPAVLFPR